ncbi:hypothetical protein KBC75_03885 [Candidatus Shapirobacteria bacterium]|nr:hypothetical protein [Candidatus Shapirobacteria bacterium]
MRNILLTVLFLLASTRGVLADEVMVRLSRMKTGESPLPILVTVTATTNVVENGLAVVVGNGWSVSSTASDLTVTTTGLPNDVTPLPGIATAVSVSGKTISFPSNDLSTNVKYGFYITDGIGVNPVAGDGANYKWIISSTEIKVPVVASDSIVLTGKVGAMATDFQLEIGRSGPSPLSQNKSVEYTITYGSYLMSPVYPLKIVAEWGDGIYNVVDYVVGSGTTAYGGAIPVVDLINRRIEWTITNFPANLQGKEIRFSLQANDSYQGQQMVNFPVKVILNGANVVTTDQSLTETYQYFSTVTPTSNPTTVQVAVTGDLTSVPAVTLAPTPTPAQTETRKINLIEVAEITNDSATIKISANFEPKLIKVFYGDSIKKLVYKLTSVNKNKTQEIKIDGLLPDKNYFFKLEIDDEGGVVSTDLFTFKTASNSELAEILAESLLITSQNNIVADARDGMLMVAQVIPATDYAYKFKINKPELVRSVRLFVRNKQVLGVTSWALGAEPGQTSADLVELSPGNYSGHLVSPNVEGFYEIVVRVTGINGSVTEKILGTIRVSKPFRVLDEKGRPIEGAEVNMSRYNQRSRLFEVINRENFGYRNPLYTDPLGEIRISLPNGKYQAEIMAPGFASKTIVFEIGQGSEEKPPTVKMVAEKTKLFGYLSFYDKSKDDLGRIFIDGLKEIASSQRFFKIYSIVVLIIGFGLWSKLLGKISRELGWSVFIKRKRDGVVWGEVLEADSKLPIAKAQIYLIAEEGKKILNQSRSDNLGTFGLKLTKSKFYKIMATKTGYHPTAMLDYTYLGLKAGNLKIWLKKKEGGSEIVREKIEKLISFGFILPLCVLLVILGGIYFVNFGVYKVLIIWLTAIVNLYLFFVLNKI